MQRTKRLIRIIVLSVMLITLVLQGCGKKGPPRLPPEKEGRGESRAILTAGDIFERYFMDYRSFRPNRALHS